MLEPAILRKYNRVLHRNLTTLKGAAMRRTARFLSIPLLLLGCAFQASILANAEPEANCLCSDSGNQSALTQKSSAAAAGATLVVNPEFPADPGGGIDLSGPGDSAVVSIESWGFGMVNAQFTDCCIAGDVLSVRGPLGTKTGSNISYIYFIFAPKQRPVTRNFTVKFQSAPGGYPAGFYYAATFTPAFSQGTQRMLESLMKAVPAGE